MNTSELMMIDRMFVAEEHGLLERLKEEERRAKGEFRRVTKFISLSQRWFMSAIRWSILVYCKLDVHQHLSSSSYLSEHYHGSSTLNSCHSHRVVASPSLTTSTGTI